MTDRDKAHKWAKEIAAWANGKQVLIRRWKLNGSTGTGGEWGSWFACDHCPLKLDLFTEYKIAPAMEVHQWEQERAAYLLGKVVEFRIIGVDGSAWMKVDDWLLSFATKDGDNGCKPLWDRKYLEFRIKPPVTVKETNEQYGSKTLKLRFVNNVLETAEILN